MCVCVRQVVPVVDLEVGTTRGAGRVWMWVTVFLFVVLVVVVVFEAEQT